MGRKRASEDWLLEDEVPPSGDPRWEEWAKAIAEMLDVPRSSRELAQLLPRFSFPMIINILCWMDVNGKISRDKSKKPMRWFLSAPPPPPRKIPDRCPTCGGGWIESYTGWICVMCGRNP